jgi:hypothetical protein
MRVTWLADVLREAGCDVYEDPGWQGRGKELRAVKGIVWHHTASSPRTPDVAVAAILRLGRPDLAGPLAQLGLERDGTWVVVADGRANHNGYGEWGNDAIGIEAYNSGVGEPWPQVQIDSYERGTTAILRHLALSAVAVKGHKETDPGRKIDPAGIDMHATRERITRALASPDTPKDWLMALTDQQQTDLYEWVKDIHDVAANPKGRLAGMREDLTSLVREVVTPRGDGGKGPGWLRRTLADFDKRLPKG